jgi:hypothetical protein
VKRRVIIGLSVLAITVVTLLLLAGWVSARPAAQPLLQPRLIDAQSRYLSSGGGTLAQGGAPTAVSYQGQVKVGGSPYDGTGYFKFAVVDSAGSTSYWSNDGSSVAGSEPANAVELTVVSGLFNVLLGDTSLPNMTQALSAGAFSGPERYLRAWFSSDDVTFQLLTPDRRIAAAPYALQAEEAANADTVDGMEGATLEESAEIDADVATHAGIANAHHAPYTDDRAFAAVLENDGSGSGLDADLLDGQHASAFSAAAHDHASSYWKVSGNPGTDPNTHFLGTTDNASLTLAVNKAAAVRIDTAGNVGVGTDAPTERLTARGSALILGEDDPVARDYITDTLDHPFSVFVSGKYAYVASRDNDRLAIFDVSDPDNVVARGYTSANLSSPESVYVSGQYAYVASRDNDRLAIFDVSDPGSIVAKGYTSTNLIWPESVYVSGQYAYVASSLYHRLAIFDVSDPDNIVARGYTSANLDEPVSVYVSGQYAYVACRRNHRLAIFDVSDPDNIVARGYTSANLDYPQSVYVSGQYAYVASLFNDRLAIFDVSDPDNIVARGHTSANLFAPTSVYVCGQYAYVASFENDRLAIFDVSDPGNIVARGYTSANLDGPYSVYVSGKYAYLASFGNDRLAIFELNHLESPTLQTGNLQSAYLDVTDNAIVGNNLHVQGGLNVGPGGALLGGDLGVQGHLQVRGDCIQFPTISGAAPPAADCNQAKEYGRVVVRTDGTVNLYVCTATGWVGK